MTKPEFDEMAALVVRLRKDLELHTDALVKSNAQCAEYLRKTEQMQAEHERLLRVCNDYEDAAADMYRELVSVRAALAATTEQRDSLQRTLDEWDRADTKPHERVTADDVADHVMPPVLDRGEPDPANDERDAKLEFRNVVPTPEMIAYVQWWDVPEGNTSICFKHWTQKPVVWRRAGDNGDDRWQYENCPQPLKPHGMTWQQVDEYLANKKTTWTPSLAPTPAAELALLPLCDKCHGCGGKLVIGRKREDGCDAIGCTGLCSRSWMAFLPLKEGDARHPYHGTCKSDHPVRHE